VLNKLNNYIQNDMVGSADKTDVFSEFEKFAKNLNLTDKNGEAETIYKKYKNDLDNLGFSFDENEKKIVYARDETRDVKKDEFKKSFEYLFKDSSPLIGDINKYCENGYNKTIKIDEIRKNISSFAIDEYV
jgi:hypothetical protein